MPIPPLAVVPDGDDWITPPNEARGWEVDSVTTASGALIGESLTVGTSLEGVPITVDKVVRADCGDVSVGQPLTWTFIEFQVPIEHVDAWADKLSKVLDQRHGWYCDFRSPDETFVVFSGKVFRYPRGDVAGRSRAADHGRAVGVPEAQLDWPE